MAPTLRAGTAGDAAAICAIYNQGIEERIATFETRLRMPADIEGWFSPGALPVIVAEENGRLLGFASSSPYSTRECYSGIREFSIYIDRAARGRGLSKRLLLALSEATVQSGGWKLTSRICPRTRRASKPAALRASVSSARTFATQSWTVCGATWSRWRSCCTRTSAGA